MAKSAKPAKSFDARLERAKLDALKELAYGASHEINNPLANISARAQTLLRDEADPERQRALEAIHQQAMRAHEMISDLMLFARPPKLQRRPVDVGPLLGELQRELADECTRRNVFISLRVDEYLSPANVDAVQVAVAVKALVTNSLEAIGRNGRIDVSASVAGDGKSVRIVVDDDGPGLSAEVRAHAFDPFYSGREAGRGLGFGLSKCWRIVTEHGGNVTIEPRDGQGTAAVIELPLDAPSGS